MCEPPTRSMAPIVSARDHGPRIGSPDKDGDLAVAGAEGPSFGHSETGHGHPVLMMRCVDVTTDGGPEGDAGQIQLGNQLLVSSPVVLS